MVETREQQIRANLKRFAAIQAATISAHEQYAAILQAELDALSYPLQSDRPQNDKSIDPNHPVIDRSVMCVVYRGKQCFLGNTLMLKFMERLVRRANQYVSYNQLLSEVWNGVREASSVRSVVKELRAKLRAAGMAGLANAIDGQVYRHYGLMLNRAR